MGEPLRILSLGAGVQSTALALMVKQGKIEPSVDHAIFADTKGEPQTVYDHLDWLEQNVDFPIHRVVEKEGLTKVLYESAKDKTTRVGGNPPFFTLDSNGKKGILRRACTNEYKIKPIIRKIRELLGLQKGQRAGKDLQCIQYIGISYDEIQRVRESQYHYIENRYPLVEMKMTRQDCLDWIESQGYPPPPRSACTYCPYHSDSYWVRMKEEEPQSWSDALKMDEAIREGIRGTKDLLFLHSSRQPLADVEFKTETHMDQETFNFQSECEGMCGN